MGSYTLLFLSLILYLGIKGRLGTYWALVTTAAAPQTASNQSSGSQTPTPSVSGNASGGLGMVQNWLGTLSPIQQGLATAMTIAIPKVGVDAALGVDPTKGIPGGSVLTYNPGKAAFGLQ